MKFPKRLFAGEAVGYPELPYRAGPETGDAIDWRDDRPVIIGEYRLVRKLRVKRSLEIEPARKNKQGRKK